MRTVVLLGTGKGAFLLTSDESRREWRVEGPFCQGWPINHVVGDPETGRIWAAGGSVWHGLDIWRSDDLGQSWTKSAEGLSLGEEAIDAVWSLAHGDDAIYAGVKPAALFRSTDGGETWAGVEALNNHPARKDWHPGGAGLTLHHIVTVPGAPQKIWVGISTGGVFATEDGGATWTPRNRGTRNDYAETEAERYPEMGQCVHSVARAPGEGDILYQQSHCGMYRSADGGRVWESIEAGLPSTFGFPVAVHPRDADTAWYLPHTSDGQRFLPEARAAVWRTRDGGQGWEDLRTGLPQEQAYITVLRQAMAADTHDPAGVYFGTTSGILFASADEGETWVEAARHLPMITSVETMVLD